MPRIDEKVKLADEFIEDKIFSGLIRVFGMHLLVFFFMQLAEANKLVRSLACVLKPANKKPTKSRVSRISSSWFDLPWSKVFLLVNEELKEQTTFMVSYSHHSAVPLGIFGCAHHALRQTKNHWRGNRC